MQTQPPNFAADIKPLFRERDRRAMTFLFVLWDYEAVRENAESDPRRNRGWRHALRRCVAGRTGRGTPALDRGGLSAISLA
jgi:hypothetical protein